MFEPAANYTGGRRNRRGLAAIMPITGLRCRRSRADIGTRSRRARVVVVVVRESPGAIPYQRPSVVWRSCPNKGRGCLSIRRLVAYAFANRAGFPCFVRHFYGFGVACGPRRRLRSRRRRARVRLQRPPPVRTAPQKRRRPE